jgi:dethiobiotin synthetase
MVCGTASDVGKSHVVTGLCRVLARRGVLVAPFKAQNMSLNSWVTAEGHEIGRAQGVQALAAGSEPEVAMNPILLKPTGERSSQVVVMGRPRSDLDAAAYHAETPRLLPLVLDNLAGLRSRFDVVVAEGAGSAAEINLLAHDIVNLPLARRAGLPVIVIGDIDRGGVFAAYGTVALLPEPLRAQVRGSWSTSSGATRLSSATPPPTSSAAVACPSSGSSPGRTTLPSMPRTPSPWRASGPPPPARRWATTSTSPPFASPTWPTSPISTPCPSSRGSGSAWSTTVTPWAGPIS